MKHVSWIFLANISSSYIFVVNVIAAHTSSVPGINDPKIYSFFANINANYNMMIETKKKKLNMKK